MTARLASDGKLTRRDVEREFGISDRTAKRVLEELSEAGLIAFDRTVNPGFYRFRPGSEEWDRVQPAWMYYTYSWSRFGRNNPQFERNGEHFKYCYRVDARAAIYTGCDEKNFSRPPPSPVSLATLSCPTKLICPESGAFDFAADPRPAC